VVSATSLRFEVIMPRQNAALPVFSFAARAQDVARFARIERAGRNGEGQLRGFQRPQIAGHIHEIRDYLEKPSAILPNPIVIGFTGSTTIELGAPSDDGHVRAGWLTIDVSNGPPGWIVDGQQRFTALREIGEAQGRDFEVLVSGFICANVTELQKQFILINNTRPLPKALVYELLPQVEDLPKRMSNRSQAALLTEALNYRSGSSLRGLIRQQTNPRGVIRDTVLQRVIMTSISDGALRLYASEDALLLDKGYSLISEFFHAVQHVFRSTAWMSGEWDFGSEKRRWNGLQNVPSDIKQLAHYLVQLLKRHQSRSSEAA
jgi:DGQHR domain-containing protein